MVDQAVAAAVLRAVPEVRDMARENRAFLQRAVRYLVGEADIRQIIDIGTGILSAGNVDHVAQKVAGGVRVAYVDNDPIVHVHANALLTGGHEHRAGRSARPGKDRPAAEGARADRFYQAGRAVAGGDRAFPAG